MIQTGRNRNTARKICPTVTLSTTNPTKLACSHTAAVRMRRGRRQAERDRAWETEKEALNLVPFCLFKLSSFHSDVFIDNSRKYRQQSNTTLFRVFYLVIGNMFRPGLGHHIIFLEKA